MIDGFFRYPLRRRPRKKDLVLVSDNDTSKTLADLRNLYIQKYGDIANSVVTLMYASNFAIYYALYTSSGNLSIARAHIDLATALFGFGAILVLLLIWRLFFNENELVEAAVSSKTALKEAVNSAFHLRIAAIAINYGFLFFVFGFIAEKNSIMGWLFSFVH